ncbi:protein-lysine N-methyltransferase CG9154 [Wyeomyia smithii]|uniref:protein-lysine N-methyltransferase CG9154 n=1 Tax=Wyeomyia smithii TaxID=174621 RepID=UPI002467D0D5|nr:protein-lysine N-methyltransferase CG9154 [Wyeomyia smithii]
MDSDDDCRLPADTMLILQQFLIEKDLRDKEEQTKEQSTCNFQENWQLSQFWYDTQTKEKLASIANYFRQQFMESKDAEPRVALLSCPSLYNHMKDINMNVKLFEFDQRFATIGADFLHFDYNRAVEEDYLDEFKKSFDFIIADPPFLSEECIGKVGMVIKKIANVDCKIILCSGYAVRDWALKYLDLNVCKFEPQHERNLGNEFRSYANFDLDDVLAEVA